MSDNPLEYDSAREQLIRERAYLLWEADGSPHGADLEYWERARELVGMEQSAGAGQKPVPSPDDPSVILGQAVEEASIQDNLGEIPGRMTDQGEQRQTPSKRVR
ncbi:DUF2934 domain-containing protein [Acidisphaera sp. L21]|uniref:DUF2934 domain-containing protein n=1 Tax=Acidisphaera sp. L21 TaxID=1641851 RepID=UPI00131AF969|nr:DUF2934 domain-containing protein [Acidisphaera sp. L21]